MALHIDELTARIAELERELEQQLNQKGQEWRYQIERGRIRFEYEVHRAHKRLKQSVPAFLRESDPLAILSAPVIYSLLIPIVLLDFWITLYQLLCFPIYRIARVRRSTYIVFDRGHLAYLNGIEKTNCRYCSYANGVFAYVREVAARTEQYWCPIRHARRVVAPHAHYRDFVEYGDADAYKKRLPMLRAELRDDNQD